MFANLSLILILHQINFICYAEFEETAWYIFIEIAKA